jgi:hypothetical protein
MSAQVYVSYLMQDLFAIAICLLLLAMHFCLLLHALDLTRFPWLQKTASWIHGIRERIHSHIDVLSHILVEFQEAQCYFMVACQAAVLTTIHNPNAFAATSIAQLGANQSLAILIGYAGLLLVTYVTINLEAFGRNSWYTLGISGISVVVGTATLASIQYSSSYTAGFFDSQNSFDPQLTPISGLGQLTSCGGFSPPVIYCGLGSVVDNIQNVFPLLTGIQGDAIQMPAFDTLVLYIWIVFLAVVLRKLPIYKRQKPVWIRYLRKLSCVRYFQESS